MGSEALRVPDILLSHLVHRLVCAPLILHSPRPTPEETLAIGLVFLYSGLLLAS